MRRMQQVSLLYCRILKQRNRKLDNLGSEAVKEKDRTYQKLKGQT